MVNISTLRERFMGLMGKSHSLVIKRPLAVTDHAKCQYFLTSLVELFPIGRIINLLGLEKT